MKIPAWMRKHDLFLLSLVAVVLVNAVAATLYFRVDLTKNKIYTLSAASKKVVASLSEPLTVKVFFTTDLPAPYNGVERYIRDLLAEYAVAGNRYFNYEFADVSSSDNAASRANRAEAESYGIEPVQIQAIQHDQVKVQRAFMGMVLIHGDVTETIPEITKTDGLEYRITTAIRKMVNEVSALVRLKNKVTVTAYLSSSLRAVGPAINVTGLQQLPDRLTKLTDKLSKRYYGKIAFRSVDPTTDPKGEQEAKDLHLLALNWRSFRDRRGVLIPAGTGYAGIVVQHGNRTELVPLLHVTRIPLFGDQYSLASDEELDQNITKSVESVINANEEIGYLADHGTLPLDGNAPQGGGAGIAHFQQAVSKEYRLTPVKLSDGDIPDSLDFLLIAGPRKPFTDYELYQLDQFLMKGKTLAIFLDPFTQVRAPGSSPYTPPAFVPLRTGLEKLLGSYGLTEPTSYVLDENCYHQRGGVFGNGDQPLYFAPLIQGDSIDHALRYLENIKELVLLKNAPVQIDEQAMRKNGLTFTRLVTSSDHAWETHGRVELNPFSLHPPSDPGAFARATLAAVIQGPFPSYFAGKPVPERPAAKAKKGVAAKGKGKSRVVSAAAVITKGRPGRIFLMGSSEPLTDDLFDASAAGPNAQFVLNIIDALNGRTDNAVMRTKVQRFNPLRKVSPGVRTAVKALNIAGLPLLVIGVGILVWLRRSVRKRTIQRMFTKDRTA